MSEKPDMTLDACIRRDLAARSDFDPGRWFTAVEVARILGADKFAVSERLNRYAEAGYLIRRQKPSRDRRRLIVTYRPNLTSNRRRAA
jgi:DNA-binding MarR family transcriptional regulator